MALKVFLCHSSDDKDAVRNLYHRLGADGFSPWLDEENLLPGQDWEDEIPEAVRTSEIVVVLLSARSISKTGYIQKEIKFALDVADQQPHGTIYIIPVKLEPCQVPRRLARWHWVNLFEERGYERLKRALAHRASTGSVSAEGGLADLTQTSQSDDERRAAATLPVTDSRQTGLTAKQIAEKETQLNNDIDRLRIADAETRKRIEEAETLKRTSEQAYRLAAEKVQRMEAEAHAAVLQEEQMLAKLEASRREFAAEAQARLAQEKRVREEIEQFRRLQDEERPRLEAAILQRTAAAARLQQMKASAYEVAAEIEEKVQAGFAYPQGFAANAARHSEAVEEVSQPKSGDELSRIGSYLNSIDPYKRAAAVGELASFQVKDAFPMIVECFDDHSVHVRNAAARALSQLEPAKTIDHFNRALEEGSEERRRSIGSAIGSSGLAKESINNLASESREATYNALSILFVMAKTGETEPLVRAIEEHHYEAVSNAVAKLLTLSGRSEIADAAMKRRAEAQTRR